nr:MAG TPA: hypothetical protein [Caudoviricetes sp.]
MNKLEIFKSEEFGSIRTIIINDAPWFVGKDVADILGYTNTPKAIRDHVDIEDKLTERIVLSGQNREVIFINESGLYSLILLSKMPNAKKFKHWVTSEVLPSIRKNGVYAVDELLDNPEVAIKAFTALKEEREKNRMLQEDNERMKPHAILGQAITTANTSILVGALAKLLKQNGIETGQRRLFEWLRDNGYLIKQKGSDWNLPTQKSMEMGLFEIKESVHIDGNGCNRITRTPKVTGKGQQYFINKFLAAE